MVRRTGSLQRGPVYAQYGYVRAIIRGRKDEGETEIPWHLPEYLQLTLSSEAVAEIQRKFAAQHTGSKCEKEMNGAIVNGDRHRAGLVE